MPVLVEHDGLDIEIAARVRPREAAVERHVGFVVLVPDHVTASVQQPPMFIQPTSLKPSKTCAPGHSLTREGQRLVFPAS